MRQSGGGVVSPACHVAALRVRCDSSQAQFSTDCACVSSLSRLECDCLSKMANSAGTLFVLSVRRRAHMHRRPVSANIVLTNTGRVCESGSHRKYVTQNRHVRSWTNISKIHALNVHSVVLVGKRTKRCATDSPSLSLLVDGSSRFNCLLKRLQTCAAAA